MARHEGRTTCEVGAEMISRGLLPLFTLTYAAVAVLTAVALLFTLGFSTYQYFTQEEMVEKATIAITLSEEATRDSAQEELASIPAKSWWPGWAQVWDGVKELAPVIGFLLGALCLLILIGKLMVRLADAWDGNMWGFPLAGQLPLEGLRTHLVLPLMAVGLVAMATGAHLWSLFIIKVPLGMKWVILFAVLGCLLVIVVGVVVSIVAWSALFLLGYVGLVLYHYLLQPLRITERLRVLKAVSSVLSDTYHQVCRKIVVENGN